METKMGGHNSLKKIVLVFSSPWLFLLLKLFSTTWEILPKMFSLVFDDGFTKARGKNSWAIRFFRFSNTTDFFCALESAPTHDLCYQKVTTSYLLFTYNPNIHPCLLIETH
jgi:hypothetical protein